MGGGTGRDDAMAGGHEAAPAVRRVTTDGLTPEEIGTIRAVMDAAFGSDEDERFTDDDWDHALGGIHFILEIGGEIVSHASVVERELHVDGHPLRTGYVEAVATAPARQRRGYGSLVMVEATSHIGDMYELGALGTGEHTFYERLGWQRWQGQAFVRTEDGLRRTPDEEGYLLVLLTPLSPAIDLTATLSCDWRPGDVW
jgi:aminoglycoside 2'-N-acetyltransferase I